MGFQESVKQALPKNYSEETGLVPSSRRTCTGENGVSVGMVGILKAQMHRMACVQLLILSHSPEGQTKAHRFPDEKIALAKCGWLHKPVISPLEG